MARDIVHAGKVCTTCKTWREFLDFPKLAKGRFGLASSCKLCKRAKGKEHYAANRERMLERAARYRLENPDRATELKERSRQKKIDYYKRRCAEYYANNHASLRKRQSEYRAENLEKINEANRRYSAANRAELSRKNREYRNSTPLRRLAANMRSRVSIAIRKGGYTKRASTYDLIGCSWQEYKAHIEKQFRRGMRWDNRREWHIDHIIPLASASDEKELLALFHFTNTRPIWAGENMRKHAKRTLLI